VGIDTVAMILNVSVSVVKMRNARALTRLRALLSGLQTRSRRRSAPASAA
jgi:hypothetical protein